MPVSMTGSPKSPPRDEMGAARDYMRKRNEEHIKQMNLEHQQKLQTMKPTIDDDTEDDATGAERARLRAEVAAKREALVAAQKEHAHDFLTKVKR